MTTARTQNLMDTYEQAIITERHISSAPLTRQQLLKQLTETEIKNLYNEYFASLEKEISSLQQQGSASAKPAEELLTVIKSIVASQNKKLSLTNIKDSLLLDVLYQTDQILKTPYLDDNLQVNPELTARLNHLNGTFNAIKSDARYRILFSAITIFVSVAAIAALVAASVFTFGAAAVAHRSLFRTVYLGLLGGIIAATGVSYGCFGVGLFADGLKLHQLAGKMKPLTDVSVFKVSEGGAAAPRL